MVRDGGDFSSYTIFSNEAKIASDGGPIPMEEGPIPMEEDPEADLDEPNPYRYGNWSDSDSSDWDHYYY